jgi:hypothetical protein
LTKRGGAIETTRAANTKYTHYSNHHLV